MTYGIPILVFWYDINCKFGGFFLRWALGLGRLASLLRTLQTKFPLPGFHRYCHKWVVVGGWARLLFFFIAADAHMFVISCLPHFTRYVMLCISNSQTLTDYAGRPVLKRTTASIYRALDDSTWRRQSLSGPGWALWASPRRLVTAAVICLTVLFVVVLILAGNLGRISYHMWCSSCRTGIDGEYWRGPAS